jgi:DNA-binding IclR family transcriptional regulator
MTEKTDSQQKAGGVAAVNRALSILNAFRATDSSLTLNEIAQRTGLYKSTVLRLAITLIENHCMVRLDDGTYQLGSRLLYWGGLYQAALRLEDHVPPILRRLVQETGEGASFFTRDGNLRVCLYRVDSPRSVRDHIHTGDLLPLDLGAAGRVLTSFNHKLTPPENFPTQPYIMTVGEREHDIAAIAAPVFGLQNDLRGALCISGPAGRFSEALVPGMTQALVNAAIDLSRRLGGGRSLLERLVEADHGPSAAAL